MQHLIRRRSLFRLGLGSLGLLGAGGRLARLGLLQAQVATPAADYKALVCVFLAGGNDSNNMVIPLRTARQTYADYQKVRGSAMGISQASLLPVVAGNGDAYGMHPALTSLQALYQNNRLAVVANVGTLLQPMTRDQYSPGIATLPKNLFSHLDQQMQWQTSPGGLTGWGGRTADWVRGMNSASSFPTGVSLAGSSAFLAGQITPSATLATGGLGLAGSDGSPAALARDHAFQQILGFNSGLSLVQTLNQTTVDGMQAGKILTDALKGGSLQTVFPNTGLGLQLQQVAQILKVRTSLGMSRQIFFVSQGGYDTHTNQLVQQGGLYSELAGALAAFDQATLELGLDGQVVTFTESEFGRTFQPSSGGGSDHAWGGHQIVMGSPLKSSDIHGVFPQLAIGGPDDISQRGVWLPTTALDQYAATLASWFGVPDAALPSVFPNLPHFNTPKLGFLG